MPAPGPVEPNLKKIDQSFDTSRTTSEASFDTSRTDAEIPPETTPDNIPETTPHKVESSLPKETEVARENKVEMTAQDITKQEGTIDTLKRKLKLNKKKPLTIPTTKDELTIRVEKIMEDGLADVFRELTPVQKQEFKIKGEETAYKIRQALKKTKVKIKEVFQLLVEWLRILPGINTFFIEQEAKIKADKIIALKKHQNFD